MHRCSVRVSSGSASRCFNTASAPYSHTCGRRWTLVKLMCGRTKRSVCLREYAESLKGNGLRLVTQGDRYHYWQVKLHLAEDSEVCGRAEPRQQHVRRRVVGLHAEVVPLWRDQAVALFPYPPEPSESDHLHSQ